MSAAAKTWDCTEAHQFVRASGLRRLPLRPVRSLLLALLEQPALSPRRRARRPKTN